MSENLLYALGALSNWIGWGLSVWALLSLRALFSGGPSDRGRSLAMTAGLALAAAALLTISVKLTAGASHGIRIPLLWFVMPFSAWVATIAAIMVGVRVSQAFSQITAPARVSLSKAAVIWAVVSLVFIILYKRGSEPIVLLKGGIDLEPGVAAAIFLLVVAAAATMKFAAARGRSQNWSKTLITHVLLITGSVVFGLPFAFLVITSFKEDRDMSSPNGIIWVPRVQQTVTYWDNKNPLYEGTYRGRTVDGAIVSTKPGGLSEFEIITPASMRGLSFDVEPSRLKQIPRQIPIVTASLDGQPIQGKVIEDRLDGNKTVSITQPAALAGKEHVFKPSEIQPVREIGLKWQNYPDALDYMPPETLNGLVYLKNTLVIVLFSVIGTVLSSSIVAYAFARMKFPGRDLLFGILLATMMLPGAVTLLPKFLIFRALGWIDTLYPIWVPAFFASVFNVFLLRQFFKNIPTELEDAARIDGCSPARTFWSVMLPLVKPALAVIAIWAFMGAWNNFMEPLIYISSPENMPLSYALQLFQGDRSGEPGLLMAFATLTMLPVLLLFFFAQKYFVEGVTLSGLGGR